MKAPARVLVCDDDEAVRYSTVHQLQSKDEFEVQEAASVQECLETLRSWQPDLLVMDVRLPDGTGRELVQAVRADRELARTLILLMSGVETSSEFQSAALEEGADGYLLKPVHPRTLMAHIRALIRLKGAERALTNQQAEELRSLGEQNAQGPGQLTPLRTHPRFADLSRQYGEALEHAVDERTYRTARQSPGELRALAAELQGLAAGPQDVVELHLTALEAKTRGTGGMRSQAFVEEGRLVVLELMGNLTALYRTRALRP